MQDREQPAAPSFFTTGDGVRIAYTTDGPEDRPALILSNSIGTTLHMWNLQIPPLSQYFRVIRYDFRGHGALRRYLRLRTGDDSRRGPG